MTENELYRYCCLSLMNMKQDLERYICGPANNINMALINAIDDIDGMLEQIQNRWKEKEEMEGFRFKLGDMVMVPAKITGIHEDITSGKYYVVAIMNGEPEDDRGYEYSYTEKYVSKYIEVEEA